MRRVLESIGIEYIYEIELDTHNTTTTLTLQQWRENTGTTRRVHTT